MYFEANDNVFFLSGWRFPYARKAPLLPPHSIRCLYLRQQWCDQATLWSQVAGKSQLGGGTASLSPFRRSPQCHRGSLPPLLGRGMNPRPATRGPYPLEPPTDLFPRGKTSASSVESPRGMRQISQVFPGVAEKKHGMVRPKNALL
jgi:hypothetical protein